MPAGAFLVVLVCASAAPARVIPRAVVASKTDGSREAIRDGELGILVDPAKPEEIKAAIFQALQKPKGKVPDGLEYFSYEHFTALLQDIVDKVTENGE